MIATESEPAWLATAAGGLVGALPLAFTLAREDALGDVAFSLSVLGWLVVPPVTAWVANWLAPSRSTPESERN